MLVSLFNCNINEDRTGNFEVVSKDEKKVSLF